jgi:hypothetical protein
VALAGTWLAQVHHRAVAELGHDQIGQRLDNCRAVQRSSELLARIAQKRQPTAGSLGLIGSFLGSEPSHEQPFGELDAQARRVDQLGVRPSGLVQHGPAG